MYNIGFLWQQSSQSITNPAYIWPIIHGKHVFKGLLTEVYPIEICIPVVIEI